MLDTIGANLMQMEMTCCRLKLILMLTTADNLHCPYPGLMQSAWLC